jgi:amidase
MTARAIALMLLALALVRSATAFNYVADANGTLGYSGRGIARRRYGSIRATKWRRASPAYSTTLNGFGGIRVFVEKIPAALQRQVMRGFGS